MEEDILIQFRKCAETRMSRLDYLEMLFHTYHNVIYNLLVDKGICSDEELINKLNKHFGEAIKQVKKKPMLSPFQK